jgi:hypothetical protein
MRRAQMVLAAWMALSSAGCVLRGKQQAQANPTPPTPAPAVKPAPAPRPQPLSIPQTQAQLPPLQQISPEALATLEPAPPPVESPAEPRTPRRPVQVAAPAHVETPPVQAQAPPATVPEAEPRPTVQEIVSPVELKRLQDSADARKQEVRKVLEQAQPKGLSKEQREIVTRIQSFVQLSDEAEKRGDMRQADALAERGQLLARELQSGGR